MSISKFSHYPMPVAWTLPLSIDAPTSARLRVDCALHKKTMPDTKTKEQTVQTYSMQLRQEQSPSRLPDLRVLSSLYLEDMTSGPHVVFPPDLPIFPTFPPSLLYTLSMAALHGPRARPSRSKSAKLEPEHDPLSGLSKMQPPTMGYKGREGALIMYAISMKTPWPPTLSNANKRSTRFPKDQRSLVQPTMALMKQARFLRKDIAGHQNAEPFQST